MKKVLVFLLVLGIGVILPLSVYASVRINIDNTPDTTSDNGDETVTRVYSIYETISGEDEEINNTTVQFTYGSAVTSFVCQSAGEFELTGQTVENGITKCTFTIPNGETTSGSNVVVGKISVTVNKNASDEDCTINYGLDSVTGKINPDTGSHLPYVLVGGGAVLAVGIYFATRRKSKLYKI